MKKIFLVMTLGIMSLVMAGCSANSSATKVAKEMVKRLGKEDYSGIEKIFYQEEGTIFDEKAFKELIEQKGLNIKDNKKIEIKEEGAEITNEDGFITSKIKINIDNNKIFVIDTIEVDGKWYVYEPDFYDKDIVIIVPDDAKVSINDVKLKKENKETRKIDVTVKHPDYSYASVKLEDVEMLAYVLKKPLKGTYSITVETDKVVKDVIMTYANRSEIDSTNYTYESSSEDGMTYFFNNVEETSNKDVEKFVGEYLNAMLEAGNNKSEFYSISKYYDVKNGSYSFETKYEEYIEDIGDANKETTSTNRYYDTFKLESVEYKGFKTYNDNTIAVKLTYKVSYQYHTKYTSGKINDKSYTDEIKGIIILSKDGKSYKITNGYNLLFK